jgi:hypothetical protein
MNKLQSIIELAASVGVECAQLPGGFWEAYDAFGNYVAGGSNDSLFALGLSLQLRAVGMDVPE